MARTPKPQDIIPDDDSFWDDAEDVSMNFGVKIKFGTNEKKGEITRFTGRFIGTKQVPNEDDPSEMMNAAEFLDEHGDKCYCWMTYALKEAIENAAITNGDYCRITLIGEQETKRGLNPVKVFEIKVKRGEPITA